MKTPLRRKIALVIATAGLLPAIGSASSITSFSFGESVQSGSITTSGTTVTGITDNFTLITSGPIGSSCQFGCSLASTLSYSSGVLTIATTAAGSGVFSGLASGTTLLTIHYPSLTINTSTDKVDLYSAATSLTFNSSAFLTDLGVSSSDVIAEMSNSAVTGTTSTGGAVTSTTLGFTVSSAPEPGSLTLMMFGAVGMGCFVFSRRRSGAIASCKASRY